MAEYRALRQTRRVFWRVVRSGGLIADAAAAAGVSHETGHVWFRQAGGMPDVDLEDRSGEKPRYLSLGEREDIAIWHAQGVSSREIARRLGRPVSTISRELKRNGTPRPGGKVEYRPVLAQKKAEKRARRPKRAKLEDDRRLAREVQSRLDQKHSPEQIANRLREDHPEDESMRISAETIYRSIYLQGRGLLRRDLHKQLRTGRAVRKPRKQPGSDKRQDKRGKIPHQINISERPPEACDRAVPGHWEGDLITGKRNASAIGTCVERTTGFTLLLHLPHGHTAEYVQDVITAKMADLPDLMRKTLAWDQGKEMANHIAIAKAADLDIYFCDPHSPWQRGSNENTYWCTMSATGASSTGGALVRASRVTRRTRAARPSVELSTACPQD